MKTTDFAKYMADFLSVYLVNEKGVSPNTVKGYRDTFVQFIDYTSSVRGIKLEKLTLSVLNKELVSDFLNWLQQERHCSASTRNARLAAIHSYIKYVQYHHPDNLYEFQRILSIKSKKHEKGHLNYLSLEAIKLLPDNSNIVRCRMCICLNLTMLLLSGRGAKYGKSRFFRNR